MTGMPNWSTWPPTRTCDSVSATHLARNRQTLPTVGLRGWSGRRSFRRPWTVAVVSNNRFRCRRHFARLMRQERLRRLAWRMRGARRIATVVCKGALSYSAEHARSVCRTQHDREGSPTSRTKSRNVWLSTSSTSARSPPCNAGQTVLNSNLILRPVCRLSCTNISIPFHWRREQRADGGSNRGRRSIDLGKLSRLPLPFPCGAPGGMDEEGQCSRGASAVDGHGFEDDPAGHTAEHRSQAPSPGGDDGRRTTRQHPIRRLHRCTPRRSHDHTTAPGPTNGSDVCPHTTELLELIARQGAPSIRWNGGPHSPSTS